MLYLLWSEKTRLTTGSTLTRTFCNEYTHVKYLFRAEIVADRGEMGLPVAYKDYGFIF